VVKDSEYEAMTCDAAPYVSQMNPVHTRSCCLCKGAYTVKKPDKIQGGSNMTGTNCDLFTHKSSRSYLNHLVVFHVTLPSDGYRTEMLAVVWYGCKTWSLTLRKEHTLS
jgi:hypothetical protein